jgi:salicylate hydroxylase
MLITLLEKHNPSTAPPTTELLETLFSELEAQRIPPSSAMVKGARKQGELRVVEGVEACIKRNREYQRIWKDRRS